MLSTAGHNITRDRVDAFIAGVRAAADWREEMIDKAYCACTECLRDEADELEKLNGGTEQ